MKRIHYILSAFLLLLTASCVREQIENVEPVSTKDRVPIIMSFADNVTLQAQTKAEDGMEMGVNPAIKTIHVAVFGSSGYLKDYSSAIPCDSEGNPVSGFVSSNITTGYFKVYLPFDEGPSNRRIHIIANGPASLPFHSSEDEIMKNLTVTDGNGAYWTRLVTSKASGEGILIKTTTDALTGEVSRDVDPITGDFIPTDETTALFQNLKLVRNFAGVTVVKTGSDTNFAIDGFTICNMPTQGAVAIYNETSSEWIPGNDYAGLIMDGDSHLTFNDTLYPGFPTDPSIDTHIPQTAAAFNAAGVSVAEGETLYFYERAVTDKAAPFVIIKARYVESGVVAVDSPTYYYRLDITPGNNYVPFYRNFKYNVKISGIRVPGAATPGEAAKRNSGDNFSVSMDTQDLPSVSNGTTRIFVQETEVASTYSAGTKEFWYQFEVEESFFNGTSNQAAGTGTAIVSIEETQKGALDTWSIEGTDRAGDKRFITYTLKNPTEGKDLTSVLRIKGEYTPSSGGTITLIRDITFTVISLKALTASFSPDVVGTSAGEQTTLNIDLPADLPKGVFPLVFKIEDTALGLNANEENVPVSPGTSIITPSEKAYQFLKTLNWSDYEALIKEAELSGLSHPVLPVKMKTSKSFASTTAYISNTYFSTATAALTADGNNYISPGNIIVDYNAHSDIDVTVFSNKNWTLGIARDNGSSSVGTSLSQTSGSSTGVSGQTVTVTLPENPGNVSRTYVLTLRHVDSDLVRQAYITQKGKEFVLTSPSASIKGNVTTLHLSLHSDFMGAWSITASDGGCSITPASSVDAGSEKGTFDIVLTLPVNNTTTDKEYVITANGAGGRSSSVRIIHRKMTSRNKTITFSKFTTIGYTSKTSGSAESRTATYNGITGAFSSVTYLSNNYVQSSNNGTLTLTIDPSVIVRITGVTFTYRNASYTPDSVSANTGTMTGTTSWAAANETTTAVTFTFKKSTGISISSFAIDCVVNDWL
jgi:hypothetical protein